MMVNSIIISIIDIIKPIESVKSLEFSPNDFFKKPLAITTSKPQPLALQLRRYGNGSGQDTRYQPF